MKIKTIGIELTFLHSFQMIILVISLDDDDEFFDKHLEKCIGHPEIKKEIKKK
ncbi:MAG: hypothetical protein LBM96_06620 [Methanobrevibacter sp.]|jgi:hypothetical protein|nr:hypothetical protein [Candidatus Methanoflexus mossambicus]